jgi:hypothetical protein
MPRHISLHTLACLTRLGAEQLTARLDRHFIFYWNCIRFYRRAPGSMRLWRARSSKSSIFAASAWRLASICLS